MNIIKRIENQIISLERDENKSAALMLQLALNEIKRLESLVAEKDDMISEQDYKDFYGKDVFKG